jgi:phage terminase large subunit-like protein
LVELPRDHGKSVQAYVRTLWELGRETGLRVVLVCASEALAAQRCRFLRDALTMHLIDELERRWRPEVILFESNAAFAGIRDLLVRHTRFGPKIQGVTQTRDKMSRAHALSVPVQNGSFRLRGRNAAYIHTSQQELFDELTTFPFGAHDDLLDAAATGTAYLLDRPEPRIW